MKRILIIIYSTLLFIYGQFAFATTSPLFDVKLAQPGLTTTINGVLFLINTTIPGKTYQFAGITIKTSGYEVAPDHGTRCSMAPNGYCLFSVSDTSPALLLVSIPFLENINPNSRLTPFPQVSILMTLCLNGKGAYSCEDHTVSLNQPT